MNNVNKIRRVINLSRPVRVGNTLYVTNAVGTKITAPQQTEKIMLKNGAAYEVSEESPKLRKLSDLSLDEFSKVSVIIDEYVKYYRNATDKAEQAEIMQKLIDVCANGFGVDDPTIMTIFNSRAQQTGTFDAADKLPGSSLDDWLHREQELGKPRSTQNTITEQSFFERYKFQLLIGVIIYLLLRDKR